MEIPPVYCVSSGFSALLEKIAARNSQENRGELLPSSAVDVENKHDQQNEEKRHRDLGPALKKPGVHGSPPTRPHFNSGFIDHTYSSESALGHRWSAPFNQKHDY